MKLSLLEDGVLDYKGDVAHPATPPGAPTHVPHTGVAGVGTDMSPEDEDEDKSLLNKSRQKAKKKRRKSKS